LLGAAAQSEGYAAGLQKLAALEKSKAVQAAGPNLAAHIRYRRIGAEHGLAFQDPKVDYSKQQEKWVADLEKFVDEFPTSDNTAEAMLQLGSMAGEFAGKPEIAEKWYSRVANEFPRTAAGKKGAGAMRRLGSIGKVITLRGDAISGGKIDLSTAPYRGKFVLVHYWATWSGPERDMTLIEALRKKYRGKLEVLGVNLDTSRQQAIALAKEQAIGWKHLYDEQGLEGARAEEMGVMTLPLMLLIDNQGRVINRDLHANELTAELKRVIR
jgi:thiol-disulfide isomerase/thioredoxin